jgi:quinol monooxygenase YgiN
MEEKVMVHVIASIRVKPEGLTKFLQIFKANVPAVRAEAGCVEYSPTVDLPTGLPPQRLDPNVVTIVETWTDLDALRKHLAAPHMAAYREKVKDLVAGTELRVLQDA